MIFDERCANCGAVDRPDNLVSWDDDADGYLCEACRVDAATVDVIPDDDDDDDDFGVGDDDLF